MFNHGVQVREPEGRVADLMVSEVITIGPEQTLHEALDVMKHHHIKRLVVCDEARHVLGIITRSDLVRVFFDHFSSDNKPNNKG
jgi:CBS domain-containing protein